MVRCFIDGHPCQVPALMNTHLCAVSVCMRFPVRAGMRSAGHAVMEPVGSATPSPSARASVLQTQRCCRFAHATEAAAHPSYASTDCLSACSLFVTAGLPFSCGYALAATCVHVVGDGSAARLSCASSVCVRTLLSCPNGHVSPGSTESNIVS